MHQCSICFKDTHVVSWKCKTPNCCGALCRSCCDKAVVSAVTRCPLCLTGRLEMPGQQLLRQACNNATWFVPPTRFVTHRFPLLGLLKHMNSSRVQKFAPHLTLFILVRMKQHHEDASHLALWLLHKLCTFRPRKAEAATFVSACEMLLPLFRALVDDESAKQAAELLGKTYYAPSCYQSQTLLLLLTHDKVVDRLVVLRDDYKYTWVVSLVSNLANAPKSLASRMPAVMRGVRRLICVHPCHVDLSQSSESSHIDLLLMLDDATPAKINRAAAPLFFALHNSCDRSSPTLRRR